MLYQIPLHIYTNLICRLLELILLWRIRMCRCEKNNILPLRLVCSAFDEVLKPYAFKTIQLEFSKFLRSSDELYLQHMDRIGNYCQAVYLDMMVVRDEGRIPSKCHTNTLLMRYLQRKSRVFRKFSTESWPKSLKWNLYSNLFADIA